MKDNGDREALIVSELDRHPPQPAWRYFPDATHAHSLWAAGTRGWRHITRNHSRVVDQSSSPKEASLRSFLVRGLINLMGGKRFMSSVRKIRASHSGVKVALGACLLANIGTASAQIPLSDCLAASSKNKTASDLRMADLNGADMRRVFEQNPVLSAPIRQLEMKFEFSERLELGPSKTVFRGVTISDQWGSIRTDLPVLIDRINSTVAFPAPDDCLCPLVAWQIRLEQGWYIARAGLDWELRKEADK